MSARTPNTKLYAKISNRQTGPYATDRDGVQFLENFIAAKGGKAETFAPHFLEIKSSTLALVSFPDSSAKKAFIEAAAAHDVDVFEPRAPMNVYFTTAATRNEDKSLAQLLEQTKSAKEVRTLPVPNYGKDVMKHQIQIPYNKAEKFVADARESGLSPQSMP